MILFKPSFILFSAIFCSFSPERGLTPRTRLNDEASSIVISCGLDAAVRTLMVTDVLWLPWGLCLVGYFFPSCGLRAVRKMRSR